jgi:hypothetical protein
MYLLQEKRKPPVLLQRASYEPRLALTWLIQIQKEERQTPIIICSGAEESYGYKNKNTARVCYT